MRMGAFVGVLMACWCGFAQAGSVTLYVSPSGNDSWSGTLDAPDAAKSDGPFATLAAARDAIRALKASDSLPPDGAAVCLRGGDYFLADSFSLEAQDSGPDGGQIVYTAYPGETARLVGGKSVGACAPVADDAVLKRLTPSAQSHVLKADLADLGIKDYGTWAYPTASPDGAPVEFFYDRKPLTLSRWPNTGWFHVMETPGGEKGTTIIADGDFPRTWVASNSAYVWGYWTFDWAESCVPVANVDPATHLITLATPEGRYGISGGGRFFLCNILEEIDQPGEYYIDRDANTLYFWPPKASDNPEAYVSIATEALVSLENVRNVSFTHLRFAYTRGDAIRMVNCTGCAVAGCTIRNIGGTAITITEGSNNIVQSCDLSELGMAGIGLTGGDRQTLTPCGNQAYNNHIWDFARVRWTYRPGVGFSGVGIIVAHNLIHDAPHTGILWGGNDNVIEFNELHHLLLDTRDCGAIYSGRDLTMRGNRITNNFIHHLGIDPDRHAIYLDDMFSSVDIVGNVFWQASNAVFIGGGRDNLVENNLFVSCTPAVRMDARGVGSDQYYQTTQTSLSKVPYDKPPYSTRFPKLAKIMEGDPRIPMGNRIAHNIIADTTQWLEAPEFVLKENLLDMEDNFTEGDPGFVDAAHGDFQLKPDAPANAIAFKPIPFDRIGLVVDSFRQTIPQHGANGAYEDVPTAPTPEEAAYTCRRATGSITVDGKLDDWPSLSIVSTKPAQIRVHPDAWTGAQDGSFRFAAAYDDNYLYLAVKVTDDIVLTGNEYPAWEQDGVEMRLDARPKAARAGWKGESENQETLTIILSPGQDQTQMVGLNPSNLPKGVEAVCAPCEGGYAFEAAIPVAYLEEKQGTPWKDFRLNLDIDDTDQRGGPLVQLCWKPDWRDDLNYAGSGTFARQ